MDILSDRKMIEWLNLHNSLKNLTFHIHLLNGNFGCDKQINNIYIYVTKNIFINWIMLIFYWKLVSVQFMMIRSTILLHS